MYIYGKHDNACGLHREDAEIVADQSENEKQLMLSVFFVSIIPSDCAAPTSRTTLPLSSLTGVSTDV